MTKRKKKESFSVPQNLKEAAELIAQIGKYQRQILEISNRANERIQKIKEKLLQETTPLEEQISSLVEKLFIFAKENYDELTQKGKKRTIDLSTGSFGWRQTPPAVIIRNIKETLEYLKIAGLFQFIRTKEEIDKKALLKKPNKAQGIKGITITQKEEFFVKPADVGKEVSANIEKLTKKIESL